MLTIAYSLLKAPDFEYAFQNKDFKESSMIKNILFDTYNRATNIAFKYKNEEFIKSGEALDKDELNNRIAYQNANKANEIAEIQQNYNKLLLQYLAGELEISNKDQKGEQFLKDQMNSEIEKINQKYDTLINDMKSAYIDEQLLSYRTLTNNLKNQPGIYYTVIKDGEIILSNANSSDSTKDFYNTLPYSTQITQENVYSFFSSNNYFYHYGLYNENLNLHNAVVHLGISQDKYNTELAIFNQRANEGLWGIKLLSIGLLAFLIGLIYIIYSAGRRSAVDGIQLIAIDDIYLDVALAVSVGAIALCMAPIIEYGEFLFRNQTTLNTDLLKIFFGILISIGTLIGINFVFMLSKRIKRHEIFRYTLIFKVIAWIFRLIRNIYSKITLKINSVFDRSPLAMRLVLIFGAYGFVILIGILLFFAGPIGGLMGFSAIIGVNVAAIYLLLKTFKIFKDINMGAQRIRTGELNYNIPAQGVTELRQLAITINGIADGLKNAVNSQVKAERMKAELITNVSHDLRTPLTSIITYVDLLKNEGLQSENAEKYLNVIDTKSQRLKALTEDLFEAAKAASGNIPVNLERLDVASLLNQGLGELSDKIEASSLAFKTSISSEHLFVIADGKLLWRVIENILSNVFKYALPNSRIYLDAYEQGKNVFIIVKNISAYELNINADELMERFKRGDSSRHSDGSGLGLSIAKSLTELQGGSFHIEIDGDLFKSIIELPLSESSSIQGEE